MPGVADDFYTFMKTDWTSFFYELPNIFTII